MFFLQSYQNRVSETPLNLPVIALLLLQLLLPTSLALGVVGALLVGDFDEDDVVTGQGVRPGER